MKQVSKKVTIKDLTILTHKSRETIAKCLVDVVPEKRGVSKLYFAEEVLPLIYNKANDGKYNLNAERGRVSFHDANMKEMRENEMRQQLIQIDKVSTHWGAMTNNWKTKILAIPSGCVHELSQTTDKNEIIEVLSSAINDSFIELISDDIDWRVSDD